MNHQTFRARQQQITLGGVAHQPLRVAYTDLGPRSSAVPPVVLLHGIPTWSFLYRDAIERLAETRRVVAPDLLGHGWSDRRDGFDRSFQDQARMLAALLPAIGVGRADFVGHDTGGAVALILAIEHAALVNRLVVTNSVCYDRFDDDMLDLGHPLRWKPRPVADLVAALEQSLAAGLSRPDRLTPEFRAGVIAPWASEEGKLSLLRNASALNPNQTMALVDRHGTIAAPTLVLWGEDDPWQKADDGRRLAGEIPGAVFRAIPHASHWVQQDAPEEFLAAVLEHLDARG